MIYNSGDLFSISTLMKMLNCDFVDIDLHLTSLGIKGILAKETKGQGAKLTEETVLKCNPDFKEQKHFFKLFVQERIESVELKKERQDNLEGQRKHQI